jgi:glycosyltransferase involved in cell wall biosynthesis
MTPIQNQVYVLVLSGESSGASKFVAARYPDCKSFFLSKRELREGGWRGQIRAFRRLKGKALVFYRESLEEIQEPQLALWTAALHRCRYTVSADANGRTLVNTRWTLIRSLPRAVVSAVTDIFVFSLTLFLLGMVRRKKAQTPVQFQWRSEADPELTYLYPYPLDKSIAGGALSHVKGFLGGWLLAGNSCEVFSGKPLAAHNFPFHMIPAKRQLFLFHESKLLSYNLRFVLAVRKRLRNRKPGALYQRHGRFVYAGALLSKLLQVPFILEYNGSEAWMADHWDPARFGPWLRLCEEVSISRADLIVVVSEPLKQELLQRGIDENRILVNPNGVDPLAFQPECGGETVRAQMGFAHSDVVVGFIGTFHYWHGVKVLGQAIQQLCTDRTVESVASKLKFVLMGDGLLRAEMMESLKPFIGAQVFFTGVLPHSDVGAHLDAADILVSPHVPMPDGRPFFGSPTKIFEYMAMAKGIIASDLDQLSRVLTHRRNAWLVKPGNATELQAAIVLLAQNPKLRGELGENARSTVIAEHTWQQNAERVLACIGARAPVKSASIVDARSA